MTYEWRTEPWEHQREAIRRAWRRPGYGYLMEMGTGKSKVAVDEAAIYYESGLIDTWVVIAPKGVYRGWWRTAGQIDTHMPERILASATLVAWRAGGGVAHRRALGAALAPSSGLRILVMNTEALSSPGAAREYLEAWLESGRCMIHLDESTTIKSPTAKRTKYLLSVAERAAYRRIMTGSPITRSPLDAWAQFEFVMSGCLGHRSYRNFCARYAIMRLTDFGGQLRRPIEVPVAFRNLEELAERMAAHSYRVRKEECLDLPPKIYTVRETELTDEQRALYERVRTGILADIGNGEEFVRTRTVVERLTALSRIVCGHVRTADGDVREIATRRVSDLLDILDETEGKVIVWSRYRLDTKRIAEAIRRRYGAESVAVYYGGNTRDRDADERRFREDAECRFIVSGQATGGYGNTWTVAHTVVYFSNSWDLTERVQSEDRAHRAGQTRSVTYIDMVARGTTDELQLRALRSKMDIAALVQSDEFREWVLSRD